MGDPRRPVSAESGEGAPTRPIALAPAVIGREPGADGSVILRARDPLAAYDFSLARLFRAAVEAAPQRLFLAERSGDDWRRVTYAQARQAVDAIAAGLIARGLGPQRPLMILSGNSVDHALLMLAGFTAGVPVAPISVAYSLQSEDHARLKHIAEVLAPGFVYVADTGPFAKALAAVDLGGAEIVANGNAAGLAQVTPFADLLQTPVGPEVDAAVAAIAPQTVAKVLFTSGSTGQPKGVINTHAMLTANQQQLAQIWPFAAEEPPVLVDWLPWNHTFGGNHNFNLVLRHAGSLYIDNGRPLPQLIGETAKNLAHVSPTLYFNVPAGYAALLPFLENDAALARNFFARLRLIFYAGAALPQDLWERLDALALRTTGERIPMTSSWGSTETAPLATAAHFPLARAGNIGVPVPGCELKLAVSGAKIEVMVRGPNVTPGYWKRPDLTADAFDAEGFYRIGDAVRFADPQDPSLGLLFDGRIAEDFKLTTGVWVHVATLRVGALTAATPALQDAVVVGENRDGAGLLAWLNAAGCQKLVDAAAPPPHAELARDPRIREHVREALTRWNSSQSGSSSKVARVLLLPDQPSIDGGEITDKGYINQRIARERRADAVAKLYATRPDPEVIVLS